MIITNISSIKNDTLIAVCNPVPFTVVVDSQQSASAMLTVYYGDRITVIASGVELLKYKTEGTFQYFTCDLKSLLQSTFTEFDDDLQGAFSWKTMGSMLHDIYMVLDVTNTGGESGAIALDFTIANVARQFSEDLVICDSPDNVYNTCEMETIYTGKNNIGYIYVFTNTTDRIGLTEDSKQYFVDYDDSYFVDYNDTLFFEK